MMIIKQMIPEIETRRQYYTLLAFGSKDAATRVTITECLEQYRHQLNRFRKATDAQVLAIDDKLRANATQDEVIRLRMHQNRMVGLTWALSGPEVENMAQPPADLMLTQMADSRALDDLLAEEQEMRNQRSEMVCEKRWLDDELQITVHLRRDLAPEAGQ